MQPISSMYIHLIDSQLTLITTPWYKVIDKKEADGNVSEWHNTNLVPGSLLRELGAEIRDCDICKFFDITTDLKLSGCFNRTSSFVLQALISVS